MLKKPLPLVVLLMALASMSVQAKPRATVGFKGGLSLASIHGDDVSGTDSRAGFAGGGFVIVRASEALSIRPEFLYVMKGFHSKLLDLASIGTVDGTVKLGYVELPIMFVVRSPTEGNNAPYFFGGPVLSFLTSATMKFQSKRFGGNTIANMRNEYKLFDVGAALGFGLEFHLSDQKAIIIELRYTLGLRSIDDTGSDASVKNKTVMLMVGYDFGPGE